MEEKVGFENGHFKLLVGVNWLLLEQILFSKYNTNKKALYSHAQGFVSLDANASSITTLEASYCRIFTISDSDIIPEPMTKSYMVPTIKTKFPVLKIFDNLS